MRKEHSEELVKRVQKSFDDIAEHFTQTRQKVWPELTEFAKRVQKGASVLDLGCGNGRLYQLFENTMTEYTGVDISPMLISEAKKAYPKAQFIEDDMRSLTKVGKFDHVFIIASLHHIPSRVERTTVLNTVREHLNENGLMYITVWNLHQPQFRWVRLKGLLSAVFLFWKRDRGDVLIPWKDQSGMIKAMRYYHAFTIPELKKLVENAGFTIEHIWYSRDGKDADNTTGKNLCCIAKKASTK